MFLEENKYKQNKLIYLKKHKKGYIKIATSFQLFGR